MSRVIDLFFIVINGSEGVSTGLLPLPSPKVIILVFVGQLPNSFFKNDLPFPFNQLLPCLSCLGVCWNKMCLTLPFEF